MRTERQPVGICWLIAASLLTIAILVGGGGTPAPRSELVVELAALAALVAWVWAARRRHCYPYHGVDWPLLVLVGLFVAIPVVQLMPLPPAIWHQLPGRDVERQALALVGAENAWMPLSLSPPRTLASLLSLVPPVAMLFFASRMTGHDRSRLLGLLAALALVSVVVGAIQLASGHGNWLRFYGRTDYGFATGFQAYRNAQADLLIVSSMALVAWAASSRRIIRSNQARIVVGAAVLVLWLAVVMTGSRSGVGMIVVSAVTCLAIVIRRGRISAWRGVIISIGALSLVVVGGVMLHDNARVERTLARFDDLKDVRPEIWADTWYAIRQHWPVGSGMGTFRPVFDAAERLEYVRPTYANRAHNDYLEYLLETGIAGALLVIIAAIFAIYRIMMTLRRGSDSKMRAQALFIAGSLTALVLHSLVDYPMRSVSLGVVSGLMVGMLWRSGGNGGGLERRSSEGVE
ncbi:MAG TPA: O-antigen ligase family protein, partial [Sphingomonas sp.]|nr:O-antigen ligase family protein [Sphingomonas sp.]